LTGWGRWWTPRRSRSWPRNMRACRHRTCERRGRKSRLSMRAKREEVAVSSYCVLVET
jgi:hypothetical protein